MSSFKKTVTLVIVLILVFGVWLEQSFLRLDLTGYDQPWKKLSTQNFDWDGKRPLKIVFMTWGSRGDHQPNVALGLELARRGHKVTVMGMPEYREIIERHPSIQYASLVDSHLWKLADTFGNSEGADFIPITKAYIVNSTRELVPQYMEAAQDADLVIGSHSAMLYLQHVTVAQALQKPLIFLTHDLTLPTEAYSFNAAESRVLDYGRRTNVLNHRIFGIVLGAALTLGWNSKERELRKQLGLTTPLLMQVPGPEDTADIPVFSTVDTTLWVPPADRPPHWYATGFFATQDEGRETPKTNEELQKWIDERKELGRKLLYFGQGSFSHHDQVVFTEILLDALDKLQMDGLALQRTVDEREPPDNLKVVTDIDQTLVFPQCEVIVHHGGAGSASQCIRSGVPGICMPAMPFQEVWGGQLQDYGAGVLLYPRDTIAAWEQNHTNILIDSIQQVMSPDVKKKARELGEKARQVSADRGVKLAAYKIMELLQGLRTQKVDSERDKSEL